MKKALIIAHFGTTHQDAKEKTIDKIDEKIKKRFKEYNIFSIYTSRVINRILSKRGYKIDSIYDIFEKLKKERYSEVYLQPTFIINGVEMENLKIESSKYKESFEVLEISDSLISGYSDYIEVLEVLDKEIVKKEDEYIVLVGHGTSHYSNATYSMLEKIAEDLDKKMVVGTLEAYPTLENVIKKLKKLDAKNVILVPFLFVAGEHVKNDIEKKWKNELEEAGFSVKIESKGLGEIEEIQTLYLKKIEKIMKRKDVILKKND